MTERLKLKWMHKIYGGGGALKTKDWMLRESETRRTLHCATENGKKKVKVLVVQSCLFSTPWTVAHQATLSMEFSRQEYQCVCVLNYSVLSDSATQWTVAHQAPLSMGILQARILKWVAMPSSRGSSQPRARIQVSCIVGGFFTIWTTSG